MASQSSSRGSTLTFGLEAEFFAAMKMISFKRTKTETLRHFLGERMKALHLQGPDGKGVQVKVTSEDEVEWDDKGGIDYRAWTVSRDASVETDHPEWFEDYEAQPMELISPPYPVNQPHWERDINLVFSGNDNNLETGREQMYCELNTTSHLHVHVGNGRSPSSEFPFEAIRNLAMILLVYESEIDKMHGDHMGYVGESMWALTPRTNPAFTTPVLCLSTPLTRAWRLHCIGTTTRSLLDAMNPLLLGLHDPEYRRYFKYNFMGLLDRQHWNPYSDSSTNPHPVKAPTIEFRQHEGTLNARAILYWIKFVTSLVEFSSRLNLEQVKSFLGLNRIGREAIAAAASGEPDTGGASLQKLFVSMSQVGMNVDVEMAQFWYRKVAARATSAFQNLSLPEQRRTMRPKAQAARGLMQRPEWNRSRTPPRDRPMGESPGGRMREMTEEAEAEEDERRKMREAEGGGCGVSLIATLVRNKGVGLK